MVWKLFGVTHLINLDNIFYVPDVQSTLDITLKMSILKVFPRETGSV